ncbi:MAG: adenylate/guanylate cyclase domain-containing protein [Actinomycetota bacterium]|nr:adenylate/guanylate cyclase domain-containing protein [Actinomycetota bacterium]
MIVVFADLAGFTSYAERHGDRTAAVIASRFALQAMQIGRRHGLRPIKTLGDGVLFVGSDPGRALEAVGELVSRFDGSDGCPPVHVGAHAGDVIELDGDIFGRVVNLAAHLAAATEPAHALVTEVLADGAPEHRGRLVPLGPQTVRGLDRPIDLYGLGYTQGDAA